MSKDPKTQIIDGHVFDSDGNPIGASLVLKRLDVDGESCLDALLATHVGARLRSLEGGFYGLGAVSTYRRSSGTTSSASMATGADSSWMRRASWSCARARNVSTSPP